MLRIIDLLQLYSAKNLKGNTLAIFDNITLDPRVDKEVLLGSVLMECGEYLPVTNNSELYKTYIEIFFLKWNASISKLIDTTLLEYNPIENYDRKESSTEKNTGTVKNETDGADVRKVSAYDDPTLRDESKTELDNTETRTDDTTHTLELRAHGNIGVTTTQAMIEEERRVVTFTITDWVVKQFKNALCICVL